MVSIQPVGTSTVGGISIMDVLCANPYAPAEGIMLVPGWCAQSCDRCPMRDSIRVRMWLSYGESISLLPAE